MMNPTDHILTQLELTNNPGAVPNVYTNFGAVPTPIFVQRPSGFPHLPPNGMQDVDLANLGNSLNGSRMALAMEMARLDVERMKFVEPPITITKAGKVPLYDTVNLPNEEQARGRQAEKPTIGKGGKGKKVTYAKPAANNKFKQASSGEVHGTGVSSASQHQTMTKALEEIGKSRCEIVECIRWMAQKASQTTVAFTREADEERKMETRINQQTIRCARNLYSLQQQIRQVQTDVNKLTADGNIVVDVQSISPSDSKIGQVTVMLNKLLSVHKNVAKTAKDVAAVSREGHGVEKQFSRTYSELSHLIRQISLVNDQIGIDNIDCHVEILDGLSVGEIVTENNLTRKQPEASKKLAIQIPPQISGKLRVVNSPPMSPDREQTLRAGIIALGIDKILDRDEKSKNTEPKIAEANVGVFGKKKTPGNVKNTKRNVIYTTTRSKVPAKLNPKNVKSNILQSTVASQLKSVHSDMLIRNPISDFNSTNNSTTKAKPKSSSPVNMRPNESLDRLRDSIDQSTILSSSRNQSLSPARGGGRRNRSESKSPVAKKRQSPIRDDKISMVTHEQAEEELKSYVKETNKLIAEMKKERHTTHRLFDSKKGLTPEAYEDIRDICSLKLQKYASEDKDARAVILQLKGMSDPTFRYLVKECSFGFKSFDYEQIADRILDFLIEQRLDQVALWEIKDEKSTEIFENIDHKRESRTKFDRKTVESLQEMLRRLEKIEDMENEIAQSLNSDAFSLRALDLKDFSFDAKDTSKNPFKYVHFRDYPSVIDSPKSHHHNMSSFGDLIIVNKGKSSLKPSAFQEMSGSYYDDSSMVGRTEISVDQNLFTAVQTEVASHQKQIAETLNVDLNKVSPSGLMDQITNEILADCLEAVMNEFSSACDGFAQEIYAGEFKPSEE